MFYSKNVAIVMVEDSLLEEKELLHGAPVPCKIPLHHVKVVERYFSIQARRVPFNSNCQGLISAFLEVRQFMEVQFMTP